MKYKDIIRYSKILNGENQKEVKKLEELQLEEIIELIKFNGIDLNDKKYKKLYLIIKEKVNQENVKMFNNYKISNELYNDINRIIKRESFFVNEIKRSDALGGIILMLHLHFIFSEYCLDNNENFANVRELIIEYFNKAIKYFINARKNINLANRIKRLNIDVVLLESLYKRLDAFSAYEKVIEILDMYKYNFVDMKKEGKLIKLNFNEKHTVLSRVIACQDFYDKHNVNNLFLTEEFDDKEDEGSILYKDEKVYREKMKNFFMTDDLSILMGKNFTIDEWIKIFIIFVKVNLTYWQNNRYTLMVKTLNEWIELFKNHGFREEKSRKIIEELTFKSEDKDIREHPIIKYGNLYITIPSFVATIDIHEVLIHIFNANNYQLNFKGSYFESKVRKEFEEIGIKKCSCKIGQKECDMSFIFDDCLFICELKNEFQPLSYLEWYRFYKKMDEHILQLNKIYDFYVQNLGYILKKLDKSNKWKPKKVYKVLLYSNYLGETIVKDNLIISNYRNITNFFEKTELCVDIRRDKKIYVLKGYNLKKYPYFNKEKIELNIEDFMDYIRNPMSIWFQKERYIADKAYIGILDKYLIELNGYTYKEKIDNISLNFELE